MAAILLLNAWVAMGGAIEGRVTAGGSGRPLAQGTVTVEERALSVRTDSTGTFRIDSMAAGTYNLLLTHDRYEPVRRNDVYVAGEGTKRLDIEMVTRITQLDRMVVRASSFHRAPDMSSSTKILNADEILRAPGALTDIQRAVQNLPSVAAGADNVNEVIVRGGMRGENLFLLDNIEIPNPNHFADQGTGGGVISLINPLLVKKVTFNAGAPPARYGGKASSVLDVSLRDGNGKMLLGGVDFGFTGAGLHLEGPLWPGATFMASGTKSYLDLVAKFEPGTAIPKYWAAQGKVTQNYDGGKVYANGVFGGSEILFENAREELHLSTDIVKSGGSVYATGVTWEHFAGEMVSTSVTLSAVGNHYDRDGYSAGGVDTSFHNGSREQEQTLRGVVNVAFDNGPRVDWGAYGRRCDFDIDLWDRPDTLKAYLPGPSGDTTVTVVTASDGAPVTTQPARQEHDVAARYGGFAGAVVPIARRVRVTPGVRFDGFSFNRSLSLSPRAGLEYTFDSGLLITGAFGLQFQDPDYYDLVKNPGNGDLPARRAAIGVLGSEYVLEAPRIKVVMEAYYKGYANLALDAALIDASRVYRFNKSHRMVAEGEGRSYGLELFAQKKLTRIGFFSAAYALGRSEQRHPGVLGGAWYPGDYDFRHSTTLTGGCKVELTERPWYDRLRDRLWFRIASPIMPFADRQEFSLRFRYRSGRAVTPCVYDPLHRRWAYDMAQPNGERLEPYHRLDFRWERRYGFGLLHMIFYLDIQNIYNRDNIWTYVYADGNPAAARVDQVPFFPAGGVIVGF